MTADIAAIQAYLNEHIPISTALGVQVVRADDTVELQAPFAPNINHKSTVFGGSLQAVATLAAWTLVHTHARAWVRATDVVITHSEIDYLAPVTGAFTARAGLPDSARWQKFRKAVERHGKGRIKIDVTIHDGETLAVSYTGTFAIVPHS